MGSDFLSRAMSSYIFIFIPETPRRGPLTQSSGYLNDYLPRHPGHTSERQGEKERKRERKIDVVVLVVKLFEAT